MSRLRPIAVLALVLSSSLLAGGIGCEPEPAEGEGEGEGEEGEGEGEEGEGEGEGEGEIVLTPDAIELCSYSVAGTLRITMAAMLGFDDRCSVEAVPPATELRARAAASCAAGTAADWQIALDGGRVSFDLAAIRACAEEDVPLSFGAPEMPLACQTPLTTGQVAAGGDCVQGWDCPIGMLCESADLVSPLACLAPAPLGGDCASAGGGVLRSCAEGLVCQDFTCVTAGAVGALCASSNDCADGLRCDTTVDPARCVLRGDTGATCNADAECLEGFGCIGGACAERLVDGTACVDGADACQGSCSVCRPLLAGEVAHACLDRGALGDGCDDTTDCRAHFMCSAGACAPGSDVAAVCVEDADCREGAACDSATDRCVARPGVGDACVAGGVDCAAGACVSDTCVVAAAGSACTMDSHCEDAGRVCLGTPPDATCGAAPAIGAFCSVNGACAKGGYCSAGRCLALPNLGDGCVYDEGTQDRVCGAGAFCDAASDQCVGLFAAGQACAQDEQCTSGLCANGTCTEAAASCMTNPGWFQMTVLMGVLVPVRLRALRRRARGR